MEQPYKVLISQPGINGHWRGAIVVATTLRDAGMEVVFAGNQTPEEIARSALQEGVQVVGLSVHTAGYMQLILETVQLLKHQGPDEVLVLVGGTILRQDIARLKEAGVDEVFLPGTKGETIVHYIQEKMVQRKASG